MKTILVLTPHPDFAETLRTGLNPEQFRVVHRVALEEAEPLLYSEFDGMDAMYAFLDVNVPVLESDRVGVALRDRTLWIERGGVTHDFEQVSLSPKFPGSIHCGLSNGIFY